MFRKEILTYCVIVLLIFLFGCDGKNLSSSNDLNYKDRVSIDTTTGSFYAASDSPESINVYKGIKYAKGGQAYRWQSPITADDSAAPKEAGTFGNICAQADLSLQEFKALYVEGNNSGSVSVKGSEDCLFLNVYSPKEVTDEKKSVLVWIHGGAFLLGRGSSYY